MTDLLAELVTEGFGKLLVNGIGLVAIMALNRTGWRME